MDSPWNKRLSRLLKCFACYSKLLIYIKLYQNHCDRLDIPFWLLPCFRSVKWLIVGLYELNYFVYCSILSTVSESQEQTLIDGISALMIFCKSPELKAQGQFNHLTPMSDWDRITLYNFKQTFFFVTRLWQEKNLSPELQYFMKL